MDHSRTRSVVGDIDRSFTHTIALWDIEKQHICCVDRIHRRCLPEPKALVGPDVQMTPAAANCRAGASRQNNGDIG